MTEQSTSYAEFMDDGLRALLDLKLQKGLHLIPEHMHGGVRSYVLHGCISGSFLLSVMSNDFQNIVGNADHTNQAHLVEWSMFIHNYIPKDSHGSLEKVHSWMKFAAGENLEND